METATLTLNDFETRLEDAAARVDREELRQTYRAQDEFLVLEHFVPEAILGLWDQELEALKPHIHRSFIPKHKKGGSVGYQRIEDLAPSMHAVYHSPALQSLLKDVVASEVNECPPSDLHRCALYAYTEEGDHIGWHYDTSYYKDKRWTVLIGFQDESGSKLLCRLHTRNEGRAVEERAVRVTRGTMVLFNGDKLYHAVSPLGAGEHRFIVTMQYVSTGRMNPFMRFASNMKDSIAYFGMRQVFLGWRGRRPAPAPAR